MDNLCEIIDLCKKHNVYGDNYRYKYASSGHIIVMEKTINTKTNEQRIVFDENYAKYRASEMKVLLIINISTLNIVRRPRTVFNVGKQVSMYRVDKIVIPDAYDENINVVCTNGIHYFKTLEGAYYYRYPSGSYTGSWPIWNRDGKKKEVHEFADGTICQISVLKD
jgi:hypothetical protein